MAASLSGPALTLGPGPPPPSSCSPSEISPCPSPTAPLSDWNAYRDRLRAYTARHAAEMRRAKADARANATDAAEARRAQASAQSELRRVQADARRVQDDAQSELRRARAELHKEKANARKRRAESPPPLAPQPLERITAEMMVEVLMSVPVKLQRGRDGEAMERPFADWLPLSPEEAFHFHPRGTRTAFTAHAALALGLSLCLSHVQTPRRVQARSINIITATPENYIAWLADADDAMVQVHMADADRMTSLGYDIGKSLSLAPECQRLSDEDFDECAGFFSPSAQRFFQLQYAMSQKEGVRGVTTLVTACTRHTPKLNSFTNAHMAQVIKYGGEEGKLGKVDIYDTPPLIPNANVAVCMASAVYVLPNEDDAAVAVELDLAQLQGENEPWAGFYKFKKIGSVSGLDRVKQWLQVLEDRDAEDALSKPFVLIGYLGNLRGLSAYITKLRLFSHLYVSLKKGMLIADVRQALARALGFMTALNRKLNGFDGVRDLTRLNLT